MGNLFRYDNKFFEVLGKITNIVILNLLCIVACLPIITIGASVTATYSVAMQMAKDKEPYIVKEFIKRFKENFKTSTIVWTVMLIIGGVLLFDFYISRLVLNESISKALQLVFTMISIIYIFTLMMVALNLSPLLLINLFNMYWGHIIFFYTVIGFGIITYINSIFFEKIFNRFIN